MSRFKRNAFAILCIYRVSAVNYGRLHAWAEFTAEAQSSAEWFSRLFRPVLFNDGQAGGQSYTALSIFMNSAKNGA